MKRKTFLTTSVILATWLCSSCAFVVPTQGSVPVGESPALTSAPSVAATQIPAEELATPIAQSPAAGICPSMEGEVVSMTINPDIPDPRCMKVRTGQRLQVVNNRGETLSVTLGRMTATILPGDSHTFENNFEALLQPGVHALLVSPCCGGEIVLVETP